MFGGGLEAGAVFTRLGFKFDDDGADRYERRLRGLRHERPITTDAKLDVDRRGFDHYERGLKSADREQHNFVRGSGRLRTSLGSLFLGGAGVAAGGAAFVGLGLGVKKAYGEFEEAAKVGAQTAAVIKSTGGVANVTADEVSNLAQSISNKTGIDDEQIQSSSNMLLTFTNVRNEVGKGNDIFNQATQTVTDMSAALGQDTKNSAIQLGKALNDPIKGITALSRVGVSFTDQQKEQIAALVESGDKMGAQKIILRELNKEFGGSAEAQARPMDRARVAVNNLFEAIGFKLAPAIEGAATFFADFITQMEDGTGTGGRVVDVLEDIGRIAVDIGKWIGQAAEDITHFFKTGDAGGGVIGAALNFLWSAARRAIPGVITYVRGLVSVFRGAFEVIHGILTLNFGEAWNGVKRIVSGGVRVVGGLIRAMTAPFRETMARIGSLIARAFDATIGAAVRWGRELVSKGVDAARRFVNRVVAVIRDLPGNVWGWLRRVVSRVVDFGGNLIQAGANAARRFVDRVVSIARELPGKMGAAAADAARAVADRLIGGLSALPGRIRSLFTGAVGIIGDIGRGIANWLNANTPLGDTVHIGIPGPIPDVNLTLPALARGGRVGPKSGGPRVFVAGEGSDDEWVISKEGDRQSNIRWALQALAALGVPMHRKGKGIDPGKAAKKVHAGEGGVAAAARKVDELERAYNRLERGYSRTDEELIGEDADGNAVVNQGQVKLRLAEIADLEAKQQEIIDWYTKWRNRVIRLQKTLTSMVKRLQRTVSGLKGKKNKGRREQIGRQIQGYQQRLDELKDTPYELFQTIEDEKVDLADLQWEYATVGNTAVPAADKKGGGAASQEDVAREALAQLAVFQEQRADLFSSSGSNFAAAGADPFSSVTAQAAGVRYFGAATGGEGSGGGTTINQTFNFAGGPPDEMTFSQRVSGEMKAAVG